MFLRVTFSYGKFIISVINREERLDEETRMEIIATNQLGHAVDTTCPVSEFFQNAELRAKLPPDYKDAMFAFVESNQHLCANDLWVVLRAMTLAQAIDEVEKNNLNNAITN